MLASLCVAISKPGWTVVDRNWPPCFYSSSTMASFQDRQSDLSKAESDHKISLLKLSRAFSVQLAHSLKFLFMTKYSLSVQAQLCTSRHPEATLPATTVLQPHWPSVSSSRTSARLSLCALSLTPSTCRHLHSSVPLVFHISVQIPPPRGAFPKHLI